MIEKERPNTLFVLGNGFDIQCGLRTSYIDFMEYKFDKRDKINKLSEDIKQVADNYYHNDSTMAILDEYENIGELSIWYIILLYKKINSYTDWYNIEYQILIELSYKEDKYKQIMNITDNLAAALVKECGGGVYDMINLKGVEVSSYTIPNIYRVLAYILLKKRKENSLRKNIEKVVNEYYEKDINSEIFFLESLRDIVSKVLLEELKIMENDFKIYLENEINNNREEYINKTKSFFRSLYHKINEIDKNEDYCFNILSFNYTRPWLSQSNTMYDYYAKHLNKHINIHGNLDCNNIIFGIDEDKINYNEIEYLFTKTSRTLELYTKEARYYQTRIQDLLPDTVRRVAFYGHSLSEADYGYFRLILDKYVNSDEVNFEFYFSVYNGTTKEAEMRKLMDRISRLFGKYSKEKSENKYVFIKLIQSKRIIISEVNYCAYK